MKGYTDMEDESKTPEEKGETQPVLEKGPMGGDLILLSRSFESVIRKDGLLSLMEGRTSHRNFTSQSLSLDEVSFLLWVTQGVKKVIGKTRQATLRVVPSAGARHALETYLCVFNVDGLKSGLYHYIAMSHQLEYLGAVENLPEKLSTAFLGQAFIGKSALTFLWTVMPYRMEWRYAEQAKKYALLDAGHVCQNLYLACEAIGCGTCAMGAYDQKRADELLSLPGGISAANDDEFVIYAAPVGKLAEKE